MKNGLIFLVFLMLFSCKETGKNKVNKKESLKAVLTTLVDLNGKAVEISKYSEKKVFVNYWATWCAPCKEEMPSLLALQKMMLPENYVFLLVSDESISQISEFKNKMNYDFIFLKSNKTFSSQGIYALPTTFVFNKKGEEKEKIVGIQSWTSKKMIHKLKSIK